MIETDFVKRNMLPKRFIDMLNYTKQIREAVNYSQDSWISLYKVLKKNEPNILKCIEDGISLLKKLCKQDLLSISAIIGNGIGNDWTDSYLSEKEADLVWKILIEHNFTT